MKTKQQKVLYVDVPFIGLCGGDKNRSNFLYDSLCAKYDTDILLIKNKAYNNEIINAHKKNNLFILKSKKSPFHLPESLFYFKKKQIKYFKKILYENQYDLVFFKFISTAVLANVAKKTLPFSNIIVDVDMLSSQICKQTWQNNKTLKNRYYLIEHLKLRYFEKHFFKNDFTFFYTNEAEINLIKKQYSLKNSSNHKLLPNVFKDIEISNTNKSTNKFILFYGMLNSTVNITAYQFLVKEIYPLIQETLIKENIKILVIGKHSTNIHKEKYPNIEVLGEVNNLEFYLKNCEFVFLPLKIASGTLTRILETSFFKKAVLTTSIGAEGLNMEECLFIENDAKNIASRISDLIKHPNKCTHIGQEAYSFVISNHSYSAVAKKLYSFIENIKIKAINLIHIPRRFTKSHWGGTENVVLSYAKGLRNFNINSEVYTTKILDTQSHEVIHDIKVQRFSYFYPYLNLKKELIEKLDLIGGNIFSFSLLFNLLFKKNIHLIHLHTFKRMGGIARLVCKIRNIPYVVSIHGGVYNRSQSDTTSIINNSKNIFEWGKVLGFVVGSRKVIHDSNAVICLNNIEYENINKNLKNSNTFLLENSVNIKTFSQAKNNNVRQQYNIADEKFICLVSARIDTQKNQLLLLEVLNNIKNTHKDIHVLFVGNITDIEYYLQMQQYISDNELEKHVTIINNIKPESKELVDIYLNSNALILPSVHEPFGIVVLEAWASSLPVIVSEVAGICNNIIHKKDALIFKNNDITSLQKNLLLLMSNIKLQNSLVQHSKQSVLKFDTSIINGKINKIYRQVLTSN